MKNGRLNLNCTCCNVAAKMCFLLVNNVRYTISRFHLKHLRFRQCSVTQQVTYLGGTKMRTLLGVIQ